MSKHWFETIKIIFRCTVCSSLVYAIASADQAGVSLANFLAMCLGRLCAQGIIQIQTKFEPVLPWQYTFLLVISTYTTFRPLVVGRFVSCNILTYITFSTFWW